MHQRIRCFGKTEKGTLPDFDFFILKDMPQLYPFKLSF